MPAKIKVLSVFGTRPEAIKMAMLVKKLAQDVAFEAKICVTAQHREMLDTVLAQFAIQPDFDLNIMQAEQNLASLTAQILQSITPILQSFRPDVVLVHGDTTTAFATSLACYYQQIKVAHIEAGLRTSSLQAPFPEEANRRLVGVLADFHFAPTEQAKANLLAEGKSPEHIWVTGNTVIDALFHVLQKIAQNPPLAKSAPQILVTAHRRENWGEGFAQICQAIRQIATRHPDINICFPLHLNPKLREPATFWLKGLANLRLMPPLDYASFIAEMARSHFILTDSGGIQEEAAALGKPVLLMRNETERTENPNVVLVGTEMSKILSETDRLLRRVDLSENLVSACHQGIYGDGKASNRIIAQLKRYLPL